MPATAFVADFIGTMNFLDGSVADAGQREGRQRGLALRDRRHGAGSAVTVAIRPEDINAQDIAEGDDNVVDVEITAHGVPRLLLPCRRSAGR